MIPTRRTALPLLFALVCVVVAPVVVPAAPTMESALAEWEGPRDLLLRTDRTDPVGDPLVQRLLADLLEAGYRVRLGLTTATPEVGLVADVRAGPRGDVVTLSTADGAVLAIERIPDPALGARPAGRPEAGGPESAGTPWPSGPIPLRAPFRRVVALDASGEFLQLAALRDDGVQLLTVSHDSVEPGALHRADWSPSRGLYLGAVDLDGDGEREVAAGWAEDVTDLYAGTDSLLHGQVLRATGTGWRTAAPATRAHLRVAGDRVYRQNRGAHRPFEGPITLAVPGDGSQPVSWGERDLFGFTPLGNSVGVSWDGRGRLQVVDARTGELLPGGLLLEDLGRPRGPSLAVRLVEPEFRSGFEKEDRVTEKHVPLPPRILSPAADTLYTIALHRREGLPLLGRPAGGDQVVRIRIVNGAPQVERPFPGVDAFVLDFALLPRPAGPAAAVLLLNDRVDGSGAAYLLVQEEEGSAHPE